MHRSIVIVAMIVADWIAAGVHKRWVEPVVVMVVNVFDGFRLGRWRLWHCHLSDRLVVVHDECLHFNGSGSFRLRLLRFGLLKWLRRVLERMVCLCSVLEMIVLIILWLIRARRGHILDTGLVRIK